MTQVWLRFMLIYQLCEILAPDWLKGLDNSDSFENDKVGKSVRIGRRGKRRQQIRMECNTLSCNPDNTGTTDYRYKVDAKPKC